MSEAPDLIAFAPVPIPVPYGVHSYVEQPSGQAVYFAVTSDGQLLNGELRRRTEDESEGFIVRDMWRDLVRQDPGATVPRLGLYVDGVRRR